jgi:hypothetical protein
MQSPNYIEQIKSLFNNSPFGLVRKASSVYSTRSTSAIQESEDDELDYALSQNEPENIETILTNEIINNQLPASASASEPKTPAHAGIAAKYPMLTPFSKALIDNTTPAKRQRMISDIRRDDERLQQLEEEINLNDPLYTYTSSTEVGSTIESWICLNMKCPGCNLKYFRKYLNTNMPVIDIVCLNPNHVIQIHGPKFYQIKASEYNSTFFGKKYFTRNPIINYPSGYIKVGSIDKGQHSHNIKPSDSLDNKYISIAYICVCYKYKRNNNRLINIVLDKSYCVIPNLSYSPISQLENYYYKYITNIRAVPMITFNPDLNIVRVLTFFDLLDNYTDEPNIFKNINLDDKYIYTEETTRLNNKYYYNKYLKYKNKYLNLKNIIN